MTSENILVAVRVKPLTFEEIHSSSVMVNSDTNLSVDYGGNFINIEFDKVFNPNATQQQVFSFVSPTIQSFCKGFNCTIFVYGQTGSGKTFTMFGETTHPSLQNDFEDVQIPNGYGVIPRSIFQVFQQQSNKKSTIFFSFLQIYNEKIFDLLNPEGEGKSLHIRESKTQGIFVDGISEFVVEEAGDCLMLMARGNAMKAVRQTKMNMQSSRSHAVIQIHLESNKVNKHGNLTSSKLSLCDLAGSEKLDKEAQTTSSHLKEQTTINLSLTTLGKVIQELAKKASPHIPYRDSKLTRLLQDSLGKSSKAVLIATINQSSEFTDETLNTLKFANRARMVMLVTKKNEISAASNGNMSKLEIENAQLKDLLEAKTKGTEMMQQKIDVLIEENEGLKRKVNSEEFVERLREENKALRFKLQRMEIEMNNGEESVERLRDENKRLKEELQRMEIEMNNRESSKKSLNSSNSFMRNECSPSEDSKDVQLKMGTLKPLEVSPVFMKQERINPSDFKKHLNVRFRNPQESHNFSVYKDTEKSRASKDFQRAKYRFVSIAEMEKSAKDKLQADLEKLEAAKKRETEALRKALRAQTLSLKDLRNRSLSVKKF